MSIFHLQYLLLNVVSGVTKIYDGFFGNRDQVVGASFNPLRDATGALTGKPEIYDTMEILTEVGAGSIAPYLPFISAYNHSNAYSRSNLSVTNNESYNNYTYQPNSMKEKFKTEHIINGEVKKGTGTGGHSTATENVRVIKIVNEADKNGVYKANVEIKHPDNKTWYKKGAISTMFPDNWNEEKIKKEISGAWNSSDFKIDQTPKGLEWSGTSPSGVKIEGFILKNGTTAYPKYEGGK